MSLTVGVEVAAAAAGDRTRDDEARWDSASVIAGWAADGGFSDYVAYERDGEWTFAAGARARVVLTAESIAITEDGTTVESPWSGRASTALSRALGALESDNWDALGYLNFDFCAAHHDLAHLVPSGSVLAHLIVPEVTVVVTADDIRFGRCDSATRARLTALAERGWIEPTPSPVDVRTDADGFTERVGRALAEIDRGDYQKVILSRQVAVPYDIDLPATYALGRRHNNPARSFLFSLDGMSAAGFSPELVVSVDINGSVTTEPLAGTRAIGASAEDDARHRRQLMTDAKEIAEHAISVKACYSEIESVAAPDTTAVTEFMAIRRRGSVQHLASTVRGQLAAHHDPWQALEALFPSITASGIPKTPALEAIYRLEEHRRGLYSGAVLTASSAGQLEATLALRTVFASAEGAWIRAGAGIVGQSTPEREYEETCEKLSSVAPFLVRRAEVWEGAGK